MSFSHELMQNMNILVKNVILRDFLGVFTKKSVLLGFFRILFFRIFRRRGNLVTTEKTFCKKCLRKTEMRQIF